MENEKKVTTNDERVEKLSVDSKISQEIKENKNLYQPISDEFLPGNFNPFERFSRGANRGFQNKQNKEFEERVINIKRVIKVTKGGRRFKFSALVVVGDKKGNVGFGLAKHIEVPEAIKKATKFARKNLYHIKIVGDQDTISHEYIGHHGAARVLLKPTTEGKGIIASDVIRAVVELAGIRNIYSKNLGTNNPQSVILATLDALKNQRTKKEIMMIRSYTSRFYDKNQKSKRYNNFNQSKRVNKNDNSNKKEVLDKDNKKETKVSKEIKGGK